MLVGHLTQDANLLLQEAGLATLKVVSKPGRITLPGHVAQIVRNLSGQDASNLVGRIRMLSDGDEEVRHEPVRVKGACASGSAVHPGLPSRSPLCAPRLLDAYLRAWAETGPRSGGMQQGASLGAFRVCSHAVVKSEHSLVTHSRHPRHAEVCPKRLTERKVVT